MGIPIRLLHSWETKTKDNVSQISFTTFNSRNSPNQWNLSLKISTSRSFRRKEGEKGRRSGQRRNTHCYQNLDQDKDTGFELVTKGLVKSSKRYAEHGSGGNT